METTMTPHTLGQLLDHSFRMAFRNYKRFALPVLVYSAMTTLLFHYMFTSNGEFFSAASAGGIMDENLLALFNPGPYFLIMAAILFASPLFQYIVCDLGRAAFFLRDEEWHLSESLEKGIRRYVPLLIATLLSSLLVLAGVFVFVIGVLIVSLYLSLVYPVMVQEECSPREALRRSFQLIRGQAWQVALSWILFWMIFFGIDMVTSRLLELIQELIIGANQTGFIPQVVYFILNAPVIIFTIGLQSCFTVNLYFNQRIKREGFGLE